MTVNLRSVRQFIIERSGERSFVFSFEFGELDRTGWASEKSEVELSYGSRDLLISCVLAYCHGPS